MQPLRLSEKFDKTPGFKYVGEGLENGACGTTIESIKSEYNGLAKCYLGTVDGDELSGFIDITVARKYHCHCLFVFVFVLFCLNFMCS